MGSIKGNKRDLGMKTIWVLIGAISSLVVWDIYALRSPCHKTISKVMLNESTDHPAVSFMLGMLMGHFIWPQEKKKKVV